jgi:MFS family permease
MQRIAQAWLVLQLTNSPLALGTVTALQFIPLLLLALFGGVLADRFPKRRVLMTTQAVMAGQAVLLGLLAALNLVELWHIYLLAVLLGLASAFDNPTRQAFVVEMVGPEDLPNAVALNSSLSNTARIAGPALGGAVVATAGVVPCFWLNAVSFTFTIGALAAMRPAELFSTPPGGRGRLLDQLSEGLRYIRRTREIFQIVILLAAIGTFGYNFNVFVPLLANYVLNSGPAGLGTMLSSMGLGSVIAALGLASRRVATERSVFLGAGAFGLLLVGLSFSTWLPLSALLLAVLGASGILFTSTANTRFQLITPPALRGRVMSVYTLLMVGSTPFGSFIIGSLSEHFGVQVALTICGSMCLLGLAAGLLYARRRPAAVQQPGDGPSRGALASGELPR